MTIDVRCAVQTDFDALVRLDPLVGREKHRARMVHAAIEERRCRAGFIDEVLGGYGVREDSFFGFNMITHLIIGEHARRKGLAGMILSALEGDCSSDRIFTSAAESNAPMRALLEKCGYQPSGVVHNLDIGDSELIFVKFL